MDEAGGSKAGNARRKAEVRAARANQRELEAQRALSELHKVRQAEADKTARLRELRLAKEAGERSAAARTVRDGSS